MKKLHNCLTAALAALTTVALAQPPAAPNAPAAPPPPAQAQAAPPMGNMRQAITPASFVQMAAVGGLFEVQSSELATTAGQSAEVKAFAQQMITDHTKANQELQQLAALDVDDGDVGTGQRGVVGRGHAAGRHDAHGHADGGQVGLERTHGQHGGAGFHIAQQQRERALRGMGGLARCQRGQ